MNSRWVGFIIFLLANVARPAQTPDDIVFRTTTKLIQVNVIAQDKQGKPVTDLRREEFQITDNRVPQQIRVFQAETSAAEPLRSEAREANSFTNQIAAPTGQRSGYTLILFDALITQFGDPNTQDGTGFGVKSVLEMLQSIPPGEKVAIYAVGWKLNVIHEFSSDRNSLEHKLRAWAPPADTGFWGYCSELGMPRAKPGGICSSLDIRQRLDAMKGELEQIADHLAGIPGRKNMIWMAHAFPITEGRPIQKLIKAGIAVYPVDEAGVKAGISAKRVPMRQLAETTGGVPYFTRNDLDMAVIEAIDDGRVSYTLGFYQDGAAESKPSKENKSTSHELKVQVSRPGVTLRYASSYGIEPPKAVSANAKADLTTALQAPVDATLVPIRAKVNRAQDQLSLDATIDLNSLDLTQQQDKQQQDRWTAKIQVLARFTSASGEVVGEIFTQAMTLNLLPSTYAAALREGFPYHQVLKVPAEAVELKLLFGNLESGKSGTLTIPLSEVAPSITQK